MTGPGPGAPAWCAGMLPDLAAERTGRRPKPPRRCPVRLDPVLVKAGYDRHPLCEPRAEWGGPAPAVPPASLAPVAAVKPAGTPKCGGCGHVFHADQCDRKSPVKAGLLLDPATGEVTGRACGSRPPCPCPRGQCRDCGAAIVGATPFPLDSGAAEIDIDDGSAGDPDGQLAVRKLADGTLAVRRLEPGAEPRPGEHRGREHAAGCPGRASPQGGH